jgi:hypothetical protein
MTRISAAIVFLAIFSCVGAPAPLSAAPTAERRRDGTAKESVSTDSSSAPKLQFETNLFDFGTITSVETLSGVYKFKNVGHGLLKIGVPGTSCDCTEAKVKPDTLAPGETGELTFTIKLERALNGERHIMVPSNDPESPLSQLTVKMDYTPLFELSPALVRVRLPAAKEEIQTKFTVTRIDGKPLEIDRLTATPECMSAEFDPSVKPQDSSGRINLTIHRPSGPPSPFTGAVQMWNSHQPERPVRTMAVAADIQGELAANPPRFDWVLPDFGKNKADYPAQSLTRKVELRSVLGNPIEIKGAASDIKGMSVQVIPKVAGKTFDLVLTFDELPRAFAKGKVSVETSQASLPVLEVPVTVSVPSDN